MIKKDYMKPAMRVIEIKHQSNILVDSIGTVGLKSDAADYDLEYDNGGGNQGLAW